MFDKRESEEPELIPELTAIERQLARLAPAAPRINRDCLMFEAGKAAARPKWLGHIAEPSWLGRRLWPAATAVMTAASLLLATMLVRQNCSPSVAQVPTAKPQAAATPVVDRPHEVATNHSASSAPRSEWTMTGWPALRQPTGGYLGIRYIALMRGVGALQSDFTGTETGADSTSDAPVTQRELLNKLLSSPRS